jgi:hypothetical protein
MEFTTPKNYFSSAEEGFSSFLLEEKLPKENGFTIPENYFEIVESSIVKKIGLKKK